MSSITLEFTYSEKCPLDAIVIEKEIFGSPFSFDGDSFTTEDHRTHIFRMNYESVEVAKNAYKVLHRTAANIFRKYPNVSAYDISRNNDKVVIPEF
jgi:hypothetical protein